MYLIFEASRLSNMGLSFVAGILAKYLGEEGSECDLAGAAVFCASFDHGASAVRMERPWTVFKWYNTILARSLGRFINKVSAQSRNYYSCL
jgi:predicted alpha/beta-fold hydrolase